MPRTGLVFFGLAAHLLSVVQPAAADGRLPTATTEGSSPLPATAAATSYDETQARADVVTLLQDHGESYLRARERLVRYPGVARTALLERFTAIPALTRPEKERVLHVLAQLRDPRDLEVFALALREAVRGVRDAEAAKELASPWFGLLQARGEAAVPALRGLVQQADLDLSLRGQALETLVAVAPIDELVSLVGFTPDGDRDLSHRLAVALTERVRREPALVEPLAAASRTALARATGASAASLIRLRAALLVEDEDFTTELARLAGSPELAFPARVAALRALERRLHGKNAAVSGSAPTQATGGGARVLDELETLARTQLRAAQGGRSADPEPQRAAILGVSVLRVLPPGRAAVLADTLALRLEEAPRLALAGYEYGSMTGSLVTWIEESGSHAWPEVRAAGLRRLGPNCTPRSLEVTERMTRSPARGGDPAAIVARAAIAAIGRCPLPESRRALVRILEDRRREDDRRGEAGRHLVRQGDEGSARVAKWVREPRVSADLARQLAAALIAANPTPEVRDALCQVRARGQGVGQAARATLDTLYADDVQDDPCAAVRGR